MSFVGVRAGQWGRPRGWPPHRFPQAAGLYRLYLKYLPLLLKTSLGSERTVWLTYMWCTTEMYSRNRHNFINQRHTPVNTIKFFKILRIKPWASPLNGECVSFWSGYTSVLASFPSSLLSGKAKCWLAARGNLFFLLTRSNVCSSWSHSLREVTVLSETVFTVFLIFFSTESEHRYKVEPVLKQTLECQSYWRKSDRLHSNSKKKKKKNPLRSTLNQKRVFLATEAWHRASIPRGPGEGGALTCCGTRRSPACFRRSRAPCSRCRAGSPPRRWSSPTGRSARRKQRGQMNSAAKSQETGISDSVNVCPELTHTWKYTLRTKLFIKLHKRKKKKKLTSCYNTWEQFS